MRSAVEIILDTTPPEPYGRSFVLIPLRRSEGVMARFGLHNRFSYYFNKDSTRLTEDERLHAVYNFLTNVIDSYRSDASLLAEALRPAEDPQPTEDQALAMSAIMLAQDAKRRGWPRKSQIDEARELKFKEALALPLEEFAISRAHLGGIAVENGRYWVAQLETSRDHYVVPILREAVATATDVA